MSLDSFRPAIGLFRVVLGGSQVVGLAAKVLLVVLLHISRDLVAGKQAAQGLCMGRGFSAHARLDAHCGCM
jgi:hypothetical protein